jgi:hypothetical protein
MRALRRRQYSSVVAGLDPAIHEDKDVDHRDKLGDDDRES